MTSQTQKAEAFADLHRSGTFVLLNAWDAGSAKMMARHGAVALGTTSAGVAWMGGMRDGALDREAVLANAKAIATATSLPVTVDLMDGFGPSPDDAAAAVRAAHEAGCVGGSIEDTTGDPDKPLYDLGLAAEKVAAAVEAARGLPNPFVLCARADALFAGIDDLDDVIARLRRFEQEGADLLYAPKLRTTDQIGRVLDAVGKPISLGSSLFGAALGCVYSAMLELLGSGTFEWSLGNLPYARLQDVMNDT